MKYIWRVLYFISDKLTITKKHSHYFGLSKNAISIREARTEGKNIIILKPSKVEPVDFIGLIK